jgi:hypothetical protein
MDRAEAEALCAANAAEHPDRETHQWRPREEPDGTWNVIKIAIPPNEPGTEELEASERPPTADDPRDAHLRNVGPWVGPGF